MQYACVEGGGGRDGVIGSGGHVQRKRSVDGPWVESGGLQRVYRRRLFAL